MTLELKRVAKVVSGESHIYETSVVLNNGGFNVLLGSTLSGKTTFLRIMAGLEVPTSGEVWFDGKNVTGIPVQHRSVSMVYQQFINYPNFSVYDNIASPLKVAGVAKDEIDHRVRDIAKMLKLDPYLNRLPAELSGGQQQRIAIARALVKRSKLVLLDEPLANLDYKLREELRDEMPRLFADTGATVVYTTTEPAEALMLGGHTATLSKGRLTQFGPTMEGYRRPKNLLSAQVFSDPPINLAKVVKRKDRMHLTQDISWPVPLEVRSMVDGDYTMAIRPHHVQLNNPGSGSIKVRATVNISELSGSDSVVHFAVENNNWVSECRGIHPFSRGAETDVYLDVSKCLYFDRDQQVMDFANG